MTFVLPGPIAELADGRTRVDVEGSEATVAGAFAALRSVYPGAYDRLLTERRELRPHVNVFVGAEDIRWTGGLATPLRDGSEVYVLPSVSGGR